jgi:hypothetical protein
MNVPAIVAVRAAALVPAAVVPAVTARSAIAPTTTARAATVRRRMPSSQFRDGDLSGRAAG